jgi:hypothetical protein
MTIERSLPQMTTNGPPPVTTCGTCDHPENAHVSAIKVAGKWFPTNGLSRDVILEAIRVGKYRRGCFECNDWCEPTTSLLRSLWVRTNEGEST